MCQRIQSFSDFVMLGLTSDIPVGRVLTSRATRNDVLGGGSPRMEPGQLHVGPLSGHHTYISYLIASCATASVEST